MDELFNNCVSSNSEFVFCESERLIRKDNLLLVWWVEDKFHVHFFVAITWSLTVRPRKVAKTPLHFCRVGLVMSLNVHNASPHSEIKIFYAFVSSQPLSYLEIQDYFLFGNSLQRNRTSQNCCQMLALLFWLTLVATKFCLKCFGSWQFCCCSNWRTNKDWSASIFTKVFSMRSFGSLDESKLLLLPDEVPGDCVGKLLLHSCHHVLNLIAV